MARQAVNLIGAVQYLASLLLTLPAANNAARRRMAPDGTPLHKAPLRATDPDSPWVSQRIPVSVPPFLPDGVTPHPKFKTPGAHYADAVAAGLIAPEACPEYTPKDGPTVPAGVRVPSFIEAVRMGVARGVIAQRATSNGFILAVASKVTPKDKTASQPGADIATLLAAVKAYGEAAK